MRKRTVALLLIAPCVPFLGGGCVGPQGDPTCEDRHLESCGNSPSGIDATSGDDGGGAPFDAPESATEDGGACGPGTSSCEGAQGCVDLNSTVTNCGACGHVCAAPPSGTATCNGGTCGVSCTAPLEFCGGACVDPSSSASCGGCNACPVPDGGYATCSSGTCGVACDSPLTNCSGVCLDTTSSTDHCGAACQACTTTQANAAPSCSQGACGFTCNPSYFLCNGTCHSSTAGPTDPCYVTETFGVFVAPNGSDAPGRGTRAAPYATMGYAVQHASGLPNVFTCQGSYAGQVNLGASTPAITIYGGFNCSSWAYTPAAPQMVVVQPPAGTIPLVLNGVTNAVTIANMTFKAADASGQDANGNGLSSIAAFANQTSTVTLNGVALQAGNAANGVNNAAPSANYSGTLAPAGKGSSDPDAGANPSGGMSQCGTGASQGGAGGGASPTGGGPGTPAEPGNTSTTYNGAAGGASCTPTPKAGQNGAGGTAGSAVGAWGAVNPLGASPWTPSAGQVGGSGSPGQGGGGGGGDFGTAGGGGGAGGCGGTGGPPGGGGGSSFALLASNAPITLIACTLKTGNAGNGGQGGMGEAGQGGGGGGLASCGGAPGGNGGGGGGGGGGAGGLSVGIGYVGTFWSNPGATFSGGTAGAAGSGGGGGAPGSNALSSLNPGNPGAPGAASTKPGAAALLQVLP